MRTDIKTFFDLTSWQEGHQLVLDIYKTTKEFPVDERFGITSQLRRAASSVTANIAEGYARYHFKDKNKFYYQARGSVAEVQNFIALARDLGYLLDVNAEGLLSQAVSVHQLINGMIRSIEKQTGNTNTKIRITNYKT